MKTYDQLTIIQGSVENHKEEVVIVPAFRTLYVTGEIADTIKCRIKGNTNLSDDQINALPVFSTNTDPPIDAYATHFFSNTKGAGCYIAVACYAWNEDIKDPFKTRSYNGTKEGIEEAIRKEFGSVALPVWMTRKQNGPPDEVLEGMVLACKETMPLEGCPKITIYANRPELYDIAVGTADRHLT